MTESERLIALGMATPELLQKVDAVLTGQAQSPFAEAGHRPLTIKQVQDYLGWSYDKVYRALKQGCLDVITVMGKRHVAEQSLLELQNGLRQKSGGTMARQQDVVTPNGAGKRDPVKSL